MKKKQENVKKYILIFFIKTLQNAKNRKHIFSFFFERMCFLFIIFAIGGNQNISSPKNSNLSYLFSASSTATATATVAPTIGLLPMPRKPIISTCAGTEDEPANCASECIRPMVSVMP